MPVAPSYDDLLAQFRAEAQAQFPTLRLGDGDMSTALQHGAAAMADAVLRFAVQAFRDTFIDGAKGDALAALVDDHLNIQKQVASLAQCTARITRTTAAGAAAGTVPVGFTIASQFDASGNTVLFTTDTAVSFGAGDVGPHDVGITAQIKGIAGNVSIGTITRLVDTPFDRTVQVNNLVIAAGGNDQETDPELRVRARNFWQTLRRGTLGALEFGALVIPTVRIARATEDAATGFVTLVVSDSTGNSTAQMISDVTTEIENWRAAGAVVSILGGSALVINVIGHLIARIGVDTTVLGQVAQDAIVGRMNKQSQGEILYIDSIKAAAIGVDPDSLEALVLDTPVANVVPLANQVVRPGTVTIT